MAKINVKQHDISDCGAACITSIAAHYNLLLPIAKIRQYASIDKKGANISGLIRAAEKLGFNAKGVKGNMNSLDKVPLPTIAHLKLENGLLHYVVIYRVTKMHVKIMDPADGHMHKVLKTDLESTWTKVLLLIMPSESFKKGYQKVSILRRLSYLLRPHRKNLVQVLFGSLIYTVLGLSVSVFLQKVVDDVIPNGNLNLLNLMGMFMVTILVVQYYINHKKTLMTIDMGQQIDARLILGYYKYLFRLPQSFFDSMRTGEIISRINDATKIRVFINDVLISFGVNVFILMVSFALMFTYYWKLAVIMLVVIPVYVGLYAISNKANRRTQRRLMEDAAELESQFVESIRSAATVKRFGLEKYVSKNTESRFIKFLNSIYKSGTVGLWIGNSNQIIVGLQIVSLLWIGATFVVNGYITVGELLSFYAIIGYFSGPISSIIGMNKILQDAMIASDRLFEIMDLDPEERNREKPQLTPEMIGNINFKNVTFAYGSQPPIFQNLTIEFQKGKMTALVGESGSGKTTILSLVQRIYPVQDGSISIGAQSIECFSVESLRRVISVVPQQIDIFATSLLENISIGDPSPNIDRVKKIGQQLGMDSFIARLADGIHTKLDENGLNLSGGQRQRIAIARALYREPSVLILDEATSMLDSISEQYIRNTLITFLEKGGTIIQIAHRLSTITHADEIIVMDNGSVIEQGTHSSLSQKDGVYYNLWRRQMDGFLAHQCPVMNG